MTPLDESRQGFEAQREYVKQRRAEDEARQRALDQYVEARLQERRGSSAEKVVQVGKDDTFTTMGGSKKMSGKLSFSGSMKSEGGQRMAAESDEEKRQQYKAAMLAHQAEVDQNCDRRSMFTEKLLKLLYAM